MHSYTKKIGRQNFFLPSIGIVPIVQWTERNTVNSQIEAAPQEFVIPKQNRHNSAFSFGITTFWGAVSIWEFTVYQLCARY